VSRSRKRSARVPRCHSFGRCQCATAFIRESAIAGGVAGAAIGGIAGGGRGAAIGGAVGLGVGSVMGRQMEPRRGNHYWFDGRCWIRLRNGEFHPVSRRYC